MGARLEDLIQGWLPAGITVADMIGFMAGMSMLVTVFALWNALRSQSNFSRRVVQVTQRKESLRQAAIASRTHRERLTPATVMNAAVKSLDLLRSKHATEARMLLARAGMRSREAMIRYLFIRITLPLGLAFVVLADTVGLRLIPVPANFQFVGAMVAALFGYFAPGLFLKNRANKRGLKLQLGLPDALDLMVICAEAGLSLDAALVRVARELEPSWPDLAEEFAITAAELTFLPDRRQAFENLNQRTSLPSMRGVVNTLLQTAKFGTPLAQSLRVLAAEFRDARLFKAEEKAARLPALLTVPMILFILPTLFIILLGPAALNVIDTFSPGGKKDTPQTVTVVTHNAGGDAGGDEPAQVVEKSDPAGTGQGSGNGMLRPESASVAAGESITVLVDARKLATGFDHRVVLVRPDAPEAIADRQAFANAATPIMPAQVQVTLRAPGPGTYEVRLYYIPHFSSTYVLAARTPIEVK